MQSVLDKDNLIVSFCSGEARVLASEVLKLIPLDRGQHVQLKPDVKEPRFRSMKSLTQLYINVHYNLDSLFNYCFCFQLKNAC